MDPKTAAKIIGRSERYVRLLCQRGKIEHTRVLLPSGKSYVYDIPEAEAQRVRGTLPGSGYWRKSC